MGITIQNVKIMKQLNLYINEKLYHQQVDEKLVINKDIKSHLDLTTDISNFMKKYKLKFDKSKEFGGFIINQLIGSDYIKEFWEENKMSHYNIEDVKKYKEEINKLFASEIYHIDLTTFDYTGMTIQIITGEHWDAQATIDCGINIKVILKKETSDKEKEAGKILMQTLDYITQDKYTK